MKKTLFCMILLVSLVFTPGSVAMGVAGSNPVVETVSGDAVETSLEDDICMWAVSCTLVDVSTSEYDCQCVDPESIDNKGIKVYPTQYDPYYSCDSWASCDPGYVCVYNPDAVWVDEVGRGNWKCEEEDHDTYEYRECPLEVDYQTYCAWKK